jgi:nucleoside-diphosphate-sugar epimerase
MTKNVIFGTGPLGRSVMQELLRRGETVLMVNRSGQFDNAPKQVTVMAAGANQLAALKAAARGATTVYNCAVPAYTSQAWEQLLLPLWNNIMAVAAHNQAKLVIGDNLYSYDNVTGPIHEGLPYQSPARKGRARIAAVESMLKAHASGQVEVTFGRASNFFGPHASSQSHLGQSVFPRLLAGKPVQIIGSVDLPHTVSFIEDFGRALVVLANQPSAFGKAWHIPNAPTTTRRLILERAAVLAQERASTARAAVLAGKPLKIQALSRPLVRLLGVFIPPLREMPEMMYQTERPYLVDSSAFVKAFGDLHTPIDVALQKTLDWFTNNASNKQPIINQQPQIAREEY